MYSVIGHCWELEYSARCVFSSTNWSLERAGINCPSWLVPAFSSYLLRRFCEELGRGPALRCPQFSSKNFTDQFVHKNLKWLHKCLVQQRQCNQHYYLLNNNTLHLLLWRWKFASNYDGYTCNNVFEIFLIGQMNKINI